MCLYFRSRRRETSWLSAPAVIQGIELHRGRQSTSEICIQTGAREHENLRPRGA